MTTTTGAQALTPVQRTRIDSIFASFDGTTRPGCAVGGAGRGLVYERAYGMSGPAARRPASPQSIFHVASVSKQFAAFVVALPRRTASCRSTTTRETQIPRAPSYGHTITLRHLIYHTSGIRDQWELLREAGALPGRPHAGTTCRHRQPAEGAELHPGRRVPLQQLRLLAPAMTVQRVSGKSLREFSDERIFKPLGKTRTHVHDDHAMVVPGRSSAYEARPDGWKISVPSFDTHGATSLFSTVGDLLKWQHNFEAMTVGDVGAREGCAHLGGAQQREAGQLRLRHLDREVPFAGTEGLGHGGADAGYRADIVRFPAAPPRGRRRATSGFHARPASVQAVVPATAPRFCRRLRERPGRDGALHPHQGSRHRLSTHRRSHAQHGLREVARGALGAGAASPGRRPAPGRLLPPRHPIPARVGDADPHPVAAHIHAVHPAKGDVGDAAHRPIAGGHERGIHLRAEPRLHLHLAPTHARLDARRGDRAPRVLIEREDPYRHLCDGGLDVLRSRRSDHEAHLPPVEHQGG
ncbi:MAG: serine hydrolase [Gemmatimonadetes bacterium]|nr:serine hydrolase [Gemmatimonadota bacterium]